jgi:pimeloyl-ACP methyl ester carboxylesterase
MTVPGTPPTSTPTTEDMVRAYGGEACLGGATLASVQAIAPAAEGGVIDRCGHWAAGERPDFVARLAAELAEAS